MVKLINRFLALFVSGAGIAIGVVFYKIILEYLFVSFIDPLWLGQGYGRYKGYNFEFENYILNSLILLPSILYVQRISKALNFSKLVILLLYFISFLPFSSLSGLQVFPLEYVFYGYLYWFFLFLFSLLWGWVFQGIQFQLKLPFSSVFELVGFLIIGLTSVWLGMYSGFRVDLNIFNAYDYRDIARAYEYPAILTYLLGLSRYLIPTFIVMFAVKKKYMAVLLALGFAAFNYSFDGGKTLFLLVVLSLIVGFSFKVRYFSVVPLLFVFVAMLGVVDFIAFDGVFTVLVLRRLLFVPNLINSYFYDSMMFLEPNYFSQLGRFFGYETSNIDINYYIGSYYFGSYNMSANSGLIADALWQMGYLGIIFNPLIICLLLQLLNTLTKGVALNYMLIPALITGYYLNNSGIMPALFSHGIVAFGFLLLILRKGKYREVV